MIALGNPEINIRIRMEEENAYCERLQNCQKHRGIVK